MVSMGPMHSMEHKLLSFATGVKNADESEAGTRALINKAQEGVNGKAKKVAVKFAALIHKLRSARPGSKQAMGVEAQVLDAGNSLIAGNIAPAQAILERSGGSGGSVGTGGQTSTKKSSSSASSSAPAEVAVNPHADKSKAVLHKELTQQLGIKGGKDMEEIQLQDKSVILQKIGENDDLAQIYAAYCDKAGVK